MDSADTASLILRLTAGGFFALSGFHELFYPALHRGYLKTMHDLRMPLPSISAFAAASTELACGTLIIIGWLTTPAASLLIAICVIAIILDGPISTRRNDPHPQDATCILEDYLHLTEVTYAAILTAIIVAGPGTLSLDAWQR